MRRTGAMSAPHSKSNVSARTAPDVSTAAFLGERFAAQLQIAQRLLRTRPLSDTHIHTARKAMRRARAILRLLRPTIGDRQYRSANAALRDSVLPLRDLRDAKILLDALDALASELPSKERASLNPLRRQLQRERALAGQMRLLSAGLSRSIAAIQRLARDARGWPTSAGTRDHILLALEHTYRKGRRELRAAKRLRSDSQLHEWRKQTKYLCYELQTIGFLRTRSAQTRVRRSRQLAKSLGDDHDLAMLRLKASQNDAAFMDRRSGLALIGLLRARRGRLQKQAFLLGEKLYDVAPKRFALRVYPMLRHIGL